MPKRLTRGVVAFGDSTTAQREGVGYKDVNAVQRMVEKVGMPLIKADDILQLAGR